jgi:hypothetical protein
MSFIDIFGFIGSIVVALSIMMSNVVRFRVINLIGAGTFATYGLLVEAYPVACLNSFIVMIDIFYLYQMLVKKDYFEVNDSLQGDSFFVKLFFDHYQQDIKKFFPNFDFKKINDYKISLILRNMNPVGFFIYELMKDGLVYIHLDYVRKEYRDLKNARYILSEKSSKLREESYHTYICNTHVNEHQKYLLKMGFKRDQYDRNLFKKDIC